MYKIAIFSHKTQRHQQFGIQKVTNLVLQGIQEVNQNSKLAIIDYYDRTESQNSITKIFWDQFYPLVKGRKHDVNLYLSYKAPLLSTTKTFVLFFDIAFLVHKEWFSKTNNLIYTEFIVRKLAKKSNVEILTISEFSKNEIHKYLDIPLERIHVFTPPVSDIFLNYLKDKDQSKLLLESLEITKPYIYFAGTISPRKNLVRSLIAYAEIIKDFDVDFVVSGKFGWNYTDVVEVIKKYKLGERVKFIGYIEENILPILYSNAEFTSYPSLYEGFGYPVLESLICGTPVVTSKGTSTEEIKGLGIELVDPYDTESIRSAYEKVLTRGKEDLVIKPLMEIPTATSTAKDIISIMTDQIKRY